MRVYFIRKHRRVPTSTGLPPLQKIFRLSIFPFVFFLFLCHITFFMNIELIREYCLQKPFTDESFPFDDSTLTFKLMGKIFACLDLNRPYLVVLKCDPEYALELRQHYEGIEAAWHWNKKHWNQVYLNRDVSETLVYSLIDHSYDLIFNKIPKRVKNNFMQF